jgi:hypothetical protein
MRIPLTASAGRAFLQKRDDVDILRILYCYQMGSTFVHLGMMEDAIVRAMSICDRVRVANVLATDAPNWRRLIEKTSTLQSSTMGSLINILSRHAIGSEDLSYLRWVKTKRDFFVHRLFHQGEWPGELDEGEIAVLHRRLLYLEVIFDRAGHRIWRIFARAKLLALTDLGSDGLLMMNPDLFGEESDPIRST